MLLFESLNDHIVAALADGKSLTIQDLHIQVSREVAVSLPNFYKKISKLIADQILIRENGRISIHKRWILGVMDLSRKLSDSIWDTSKKEILTLNEGSSIEYFAGSLLEIDGIWGDLMIQLNLHYGKSVDTYVYQAHPYYVLGMRETEIEFFRHEMTLSKVHYLTGNTGILDLYGLSFYRELNIEASATENIPFLREGYCVTVIGEHVFELIYPTHISEYFWLLFETTSSLESYNIELFQRIFEIRSRVKLSVKRNKKLASLVREGFIVK